MSLKIIVEIPTGDVRMLRNCDIAGCEIQTGDTGTPLYRASIFYRWKYHKIPKISPSKYKPLKLVTQKTLHQIAHRAPDKPPEAYTWKVPSNTK